MRRRYPCWSFRLKSILILYHVSGKSQEQNAKNRKDIFAQADTLNQADKKAEGKGVNLRPRPREFPRTGKCSTSPSCFFRGAIARITISRTTIFRIDDNLVVSIHADLSVREIPTSVGKILAPFELALSLRLAHARVCLHSLTHLLFSGHPHECGEVRRL